MSYTPTNWQTGDTVTAEKLNNVEEGIQEGLSLGEIATIPYIVNLTPTAQDFSGTMDKTVEEISNAYEAGRKIVFRMFTSETTFLTAVCTVTAYNANYSYLSFNAYVLTDTPFDALIYAFTGLTNSGEKNTYHTVIYPLTPMS